jgi:hypothetical protein
MVAPRWRLIVIAFWSSFGLTYVATALLASGASHLLGFSSFRDVVDDHAIVPARFALIVVLLTLIAELVTGTAALVLLIAQSSAVPALLLFAFAGALGVGFVAYVRRLLRQPDRASSCGCSPLASPLTSASQLPGVALSTVSAVALAATFLLDRNMAAAHGDSFGSLGLLPPLWGVTLAVLVMLVPASVPSLAVDRRP